MTPQEEQLLDALVQKVNQTQLQEKDPDAEALLNQSLGRNPDALYVLAQAVLVQNIALEQARARIAQLQQPPQQPQPVRATSFLGSLLGHRNLETTPPQPGYQPVNPQYVQPAPAATPVYEQPQYVPVAGGPPSFLLGAMQTAAGVAAGALAFEGVESVLHGLGGLAHPGFGWGGLGVGGGFDRPVEETVINNNYYDDPAEHGERHYQQSADHGTNQGAADFNDASYSAERDDRNELDNSNFDNSNLDDNSGFDDSNSSFDSSGSDLL